MKKTVALVLLVFFVVSCGGRVPSPQTAHGKVQRHFQKYGKKYKESDFGRSKLERVEIGSVREIQKKLAEVEAYAYLSDGTVYRVRVTLRKKTFGWRVVSWETLGRA
ncbi:MAG TPA: hypothetical protein VLJ37_06075 [bacterium]|nr:hypothetical protein [bacterium]